MRVEGRLNANHNQGDTVRRETILMIWIGGFMLAVALYFIGPDHFMDACLDVVDRIEAAFHNIAFMLGAQAYSVVRALGIALYVVFAILAILAAQRGHRGVGALMVVSIILLVLVWRPYSPYPAPLGRWLLALALEVVGGVVMTQRLMAPGFRRGSPPPPPYPPGRTL